MAEYSTIFVTKTINPDIMNPEKSTCPSREHLCSVAGARASRLADQEIPSLLIPFRGEFPLLDPTEMAEFRRAIREKQWIEELPPKFRYAADEGSRMVCLIERFAAFLRAHDVSDCELETAPGTEKNRWLRSWIEAEGIDEEEFEVKRFREGFVPVRSRLTDLRLSSDERLALCSEVIARRAYWDDLSPDFGTIEWARKLLNLALYDHYGGDLTELLARYRAAHPDYADRIPVVLILYIDYLRTGRVNSIVGCALRSRARLSEKRLIETLTEELRKRLKPVYCTNDDENPAWTIIIDSRSDEELFELASSFDDTKQGRDFLAFGTTKPAARTSRKRKR